MLRPLIYQYMVPALVLTSFLVSRHAILEEHFPAQRCGENLCDVVTITQALECLAGKLVCLAACGCPYVSFSLCLPGVDFKVKRMVIGDLPLQLAIWVRIASPYSHWKSLPRGGLSGPLLTILLLPTCLPY